MVSITQSSSRNAAHASRNNRRRNWPNPAAGRHHPLSFIDLCAGVGGFHLAFDGLAQCVLVSERDEAARRTYALNFGADLGKRRVPFVGDLYAIAPAMVPRHDILCAGFPCQPFSIAGTQEGFTHSEGNMFFMILQLLHAQRTPVLLLENVKNLQSHDGGRTFALIKQHLEQEGYFLKHQVLDGSKYGNVPQHRERVFIVGFRDKAAWNRFEFPAPLPLSQTVDKVIDFGKRQTGSVYQTDTSRKVVREMLAGVKKKGVFYRLHRSHVVENKHPVCPTLMAVGANTDFPLIRDNYGVRRLTPRECFDLQGFPDDFVLPEMPDSQLYKQAGNSIVVPVARRIAERIVGALRSSGDGNEPATKTETRVA